MDQLNFDGQVAVVTGAGAGLGKTYALELARRGAKVVVNDVGSDPDGTGSATGPAEATVQEIVSQGGEAVASVRSVATAEGGKAIIDTAREAFGRVDVLINNAGILRDKSFLKLDAEDFKSVLDVHLMGAIHVTQPAFSLMKDQSYGRIVFTSSASGMFGNFGQANYAAAKAALVGLSNVVALEGARAGINSNVILPVARTRLTADLLGPMTDAVDPEFVTPLAVYLASRECTITHEAFAAGGGWYARVFVGLTPGWFSGKGRRPSAEEIGEHLGDIRAEDGYEVPLDATAAAMPLMKLLG